MENTQEDKIIPFKRGEGFENFYKKNFSKVNLTLLFMGVDETTADDLVQEAFTRLWVSWDKFDNDPARMKFLKVVSRNLWIDTYRKKQRDRQFANHSEAEFSTQEMIDYQDLLETTRRALHRYDGDKKDMFFEIKMKGTPYKEVAAKFNVNVKTLERYMTEMSKSVKTFVKKYYPHISAWAAILNAL